MTPKEMHKQQVTRVAGELTTTVKEQARGRWSQVQTAERNEGGRHVWRFRGPGKDERFLAIEHRAMVQGPDAAASLLAQLKTGQWLDLLGQETSVLLAPDGKLTALPAR